MGKVAFCFPGQGSQRVGMGGELAARFPESAEVYEQAAEAVGFDLRRVCVEGPLEELSRTEVTQPALVATEVAALRAVEAHTGLRADVVVGHSVGEYAALVAAGALDAPAAIGLVRERGLATAAVDAPGAMAAVLGLADEEVERLCSAADRVWTANYNCPGQVVVSGSEEGVTAVADGAREAGGKVIRLRVAGAFHSPLMAPAAGRLEPAVAATGFAEMRTQFMSTVTNKLETAVEVPRLLVEQLTAPVRFTQAVQALIADGVTTFVEIGPGQVLAGLVKRIDAGVAAVSVGEPDDLPKAEASLANA
jgi:[acyl-carrier-protein] S-malonyltransferase